MPFHALLHPAIAVATATIFGLDHNGNSRSMSYKILAR